MYALLAPDPGLTAGGNGGTHIPLEDIGMMRCVPTVTIIEPTDSIVLSDMLKQTKDIYGVFYIRLSRKKQNKSIWQVLLLKLEKSNTLREGRDATIITLKWNMCGGCM